MTTLLICEKKSAASRIAHLLSGGDQTQRSYHKHPYFEFKRKGEDYICVPLRGHIVQYDYPKKYNNWGRVDEEKLIWVEPEKKMTSKRIANLLKKKGKEVDRIVVATDYDREGELIGLEAVRIAQNDSEIPIERARFSSLSKTELEETFSNLKGVDVKLAESADSRQVIDLAWGAVLTRFLSKASGRYGKNFLSVGRVQSPTLAIVVHRDHEIDEFEPEPYWKLTALLEKKIEFEAHYKDDRVWDKEKAEKIYKKVEEADQAETVAFEERTKKDWPPSPFNTTTFLSDANKIGLSPSQAMSIAESLYTAGWISYPRTENTVYPKSLNLKEQLKKLKRSELSKEVDEILSQDKIYPTKGKKKTTDHPPIYPIKPATKKQLSGNQWKVYELVLRRFLATLAPYGVKRLRKAEFDIEGEEFRSKGTELIRPGWRKYYPYYKAKEVKIPSLEKGEMVDILDMLIDEKETKPPNRHSQGSLVKIMEKKGLGTKSTRHGIIQKLYDRDFIRGKVPSSTNSGKSVIDTLESHAEMVTKPEMTSRLEEDMEKIAQGDMEKEQVIEESREMLQTVIESLKKDREEIRKELKQSLTDQNAVGVCPKCEDGTLLIRKSKNGRFVGCSNYPECENTYSLPRSGRIKEGDGDCPECGSPKIKVYHSGDTEELCIDVRCDHSHEQRYRGRCPECGGDIREQRSYRGKRFLGCSNFPECDNTYPIPQRGNILSFGESCPECGAPLQKMLKKNKEPWIFCPNPDCSYKFEGKDKK